MTQFVGYDFIGDIHGHADALYALLLKLGYQQSDGGFAHSERQVIFLGDFIDRGPKIREVLETVRSMLDHGAAQAVMGNHELNALAFHTSSAESRPGDFLRARTVKNIRQHAATLVQLNDAELTRALEWFRELPMWLEVTTANGAKSRAVHACWSDEQIICVERGLENYGGVTAQFLSEATNKHTALFKAVEIVLKGKEIRLPAGYSYKDKEGNKRTAVRARWFELPAVGALYQDYALQADPLECDIAIPDSALADCSAYGLDQPPVLVGHYWLHDDPPQRLAANVACLDYSVAKGGYLCAYRWDGEAEIDNRNFVW